MLKEQEMNNYYKDDDTPSYDGSSVNINPNLENIFNSKFSDGRSKISEVSTLDPDDINDSDNSKVYLKRRRRRKNPIKIDTEN